MDIELRSIRISHILAIPLMDEFTKVSLLMHGASEKLCYGVTLTVIILLVQFPADHKLMNSALLALIRLKRADVSTNIGNKVTYCRLKPFRGNFVVSTTTNSRYDSH